MFKIHLANANKRAKKKNIKINITLNDLKYVWEKQKGICPYSNKAMINYNTTCKRTGDRSLFASLDRINSKLGYIRGNIQFVSFIAQVAKNSFSERVFVDFCVAVSKNYEGKKC